MRTSFLSLCLVGLSLLIGGCAATNGNARRIVEGQQPGQATGAGATFMGPANSAAPSTQVAQRRVGYYPAPKQDIPLPFYGKKLDVAVKGQDVAEMPVNRTEQPVPAWIDERVETTYGQHQDAAAMIKVASAVGMWGKARVFGVLAILFGIAVLLYSHGNPDGYPVIGWSVAGAGVFLVAFDPSPWWLTLLIPVGLFYVAQKLAEKGILRFPV
jgi:hypothetical protein